MSNAVVVPAAQPIIPLGVLRQYLQALVPDLEWLLEQVQAQHGWIRYPPLLLRAIANLRVGDYPLLYENERALYLVGLVPFFEKDGLRRISDEFEAASVDERGEFISELLSFLPQASNFLQLPKTWAGALRQARAFRRLPHDEQVRSIRQARHLLSGFLAVFHQIMSMMLHGEKLTALVTRAKAGHQDAYMKAIQIDSRIFSVIPYFSQRFQEARSTSDSAFCEGVSYRLRAAPFSGKVQHRSLWLSLAVIDWLGWLDRLSDRELLELVDESQVGALSERVADVTGLGKCRRQYLRFQKRGTLSIH